MTSHFDSIVIGTGQSGPALAARLSGADQKVAVIERKLFGGTCVNTGCIPTKAMVANAYVAHLARRATEYGVTVGDGSVSVDMKQVKARKDRISGNSNRGVESWMRGLKNATVYHGHARFGSSRTISVNGELLEAENIFINVGARALVPAIAGLDQVRYLTNSSVMELEVLPEHLIVIGGSYVGLEFAQIFRRFGSKVTVIEKGPRLISREDEDVSEAVQQILAKEDIRFRMNAKCITAKPRDESIVAGVDCESEDREVEGTHLLVAVGRVPNTHDLGLDKAGVEMDKRGYIQVDDQLRTNVPGIWALGDCNGRGAFTHTSYNDYEIVAANLLENEARKVSDRITAYALFIDPPLGRIGMTEAEVRKTGRNALIATRPMTKVSRAVEKGETQGFMKVLADADSKQLLGAAILGVTGDEVIHSLLDLMYAKAHYTVLTHAIHIHPTVSELMPTMLGELKPLV